MHYCDTFHVISYLLKRTNWAKTVHWFFPLDFQGTIWALLRQYLDPEYLVQVIYYLSVTIMYRLVPEQNRHF